MRFLLDTSVISELVKPAPDNHVIEWLKRIDEASLYLSVLTIGEIERGIARQRTIDPGFSATLAAWLDRVLALYGERVLPFELRTARRWGVLSAALGNDSADLMIAATALEHGLTVVTRNLSDFEPTGVAVLDPFSRRPGRKS